MTTNILFMCPHSAGKSLAAATYFRAAAARTGIDVRIAVAGPEPDQVNMPPVVGALADQGYTIGWEPELVTVDHTSQADVLVSIGCDHGSIPTTSEIIEWDVPLISQDLMGSLQAIHAHAETLAKSLASA